MILLDTDHLTVLMANWHSQHVVLSSRIARSTDRDLVVSAPTLEEQLRG